MTTSTADPTRNPIRWLAISSPSIDIAATRAELDRSEGDQAAMCRWIPQCDKQEDSERNIEAEHHRVASIRISRMQ
jgi:urocanate hydratase